MGNKVKVIVADDHALFSHGLRLILQERPDLEVVGEARDGLELLRLVGKQMPDLVFLDISMPSLRGIEAMQEIRRAHPMVKVLVVTMHAEEEYLLQAISAGVDGYVLKDDPEEILFAAIESIQQGKPYISPRLSEQGVHSAEVWGPGVLDPVDSELLTVREREVLKLIVDGNSNKDAAELLGISVRTVERHRANIMNKLKIRRTAELVRYAVRKRIN
jgi:DNA-binding NarL/FixJ family response regulator